MHAYALRRFSLKAGLFAATISIPASQAFAETPHQLYNKTVQINWSVSVAETGPDGQKKNPTIAINHTIYVSAAGRLFERASRSSRKGMRQSENAPDQTRNAGGEARAMHFEGSRLVGNNAFAAGALRFVATFDPGFSSCTVAVTYGREAGSIKRKGIDGVMYTIDSLVASGETCSIREGNPFAG
jgi:hypothetical protein